MGIDPVDFDGYINKKGYRSQFEKNVRTYQSTDTEKCISETTR